MKIIGVIPARLGSTRLAEKVLAPIAGKPMIQHVWERVRGSRLLNEVIVACDHERIAACVSCFGGRAILTRADHPNGSSRVAEIAKAHAADVFINIQGDEPMIQAESIDRLCEVFLKDPHLQVGTLAVRLKSREEYENPNGVKVVCDHKGDALYFSRSPIPYFRDSVGEIPFFLKHLGIYGYRRDFLLEYILWPPGELEMFERLEQLRILEHGERIRVVETPYDSWSVDTREDLERVEMKLRTESYEKAGRGR